MICIDLTLTVQAWRPKAHIFKHCISVVLFVVLNILQFCSVIAVIYFAIQSTSTKIAEIALECLKIYAYLDRTNPEEFLVKTQIANNVLKIQFIGRHKNGKYFHFCALTLSLSLSVCLSYLYGFIRNFRCFRQPYKCIYNA